MARAPVVEPSAGAEAEAKAALLLRLRQGGIRSIAVLRAMETVPRGHFLSDRCAAEAMRDIALPIGCGQTTPRPSLVGAMLQALDCTAGSSVLEVGSGSGFVTALLATLAGTVRSIDRYRSLAEAARARLRDLGLERAVVDWGDGLAPDDDWFDRIILHAAVPRVPAALLDRLNPGGRLVCPLDAGVLAPWQVLVRVTHDTQDRPEPICPSRLPAARPGRSHML